MATSASFEFIYHCTCNSKKLIQLSAAVIPHDVQVYKTISINDFYKKKDSYGCRAKAEARLNFASLTRQPILLWCKMNKPQTLKKGKLSAAPAT
jgi:hypothetical protein